MDNKIKSKKDRNLEEISKLYTESKKILKLTMTGQAIGMSIWGGTLIYNLYNLDNPSHFYNAGFTITVLSSICSIPFIWYNNKKINELSDHTKI